ncbi:MAG: diaminopimelate epimerase [Bacteroidetes bacterium QH_2_63_10]|nr:MAG: diaminopimelate epimerase [Bacteroidetes bacterium QH_2_63_10]
MTDPQRISFTKMQGTGNDFIVLDNRTYRLSAAALSACAAEWCPRRYGVGADGLLALDDSQTPTADYRMHYVNADGSRATMCGNGARCLFRFAQAAGFETDTLTFDTDAGLYRATSTDDERALVRLFVPEPTDVQFEVVLDEAVPGAIRALHYTHAGTEHLVALVDDVEAIPVRDWGRRLRHDPSLAPTGANVNFAAVDEDGDVHLRTYEKGVENETLSCGTGVLATAVVVQRLGRVEADADVRVHTRGGELRVGTTNADRSAERYLEGPAVPVFQGTVSRPE